MGREEVEEVESKLCLFGCQQKDLAKFYLSLYINSKKIRKIHKKLDKITK